MPTAAALINQSAPACANERTQNKKVEDLGCDLIGVGSPIMDLLAHVDDSFLREHVAGEKGGMVLVDNIDIATLVEKLPPLRFTTNNGKVEDARHKLTDDGSAAKAVLRTPSGLAQNKKVEDLPGGAAANTTLAAAKLGLSTAFLGKIGSDTTAAQYLANFREHGVDTARFKQHATLPNARCLSLVTPDGQRTMRTHLGAAMTLAPEEISAADFAGVRHAHIEGYLLFNPALADAVLTAARAAGCTLSLDLGSFEVVGVAREWIFRQLEQGIDIVFANEDEARALFAGEERATNGRRAQHTPSGEPPPTSTPNKQVEDLARFGGIAAVKIGADGAWIAHGDVLHRISPVPVTQVIDTTGAGDAWAGGFLYAHLRGAPLSTAGALGSLLGAEAVQHLGAAIPDYRWPKIRTKAAELLAPHTA